MKVNKIFKTFALSVAAMTLFAVPVMAASMDFDFYVEIGDGVDDTQYTDNTLKTDNDDYARVTYTYSNITANDDFRFCVVGQRGDNSVYSQNIKATAVTGTYYLDYITDTYNGNFYRLRGRTYEYYVHVSGDWAP